MELWIARPERAEYCLVFTSKPERKYDFYGERYCWVSAENGNDYGVLPKSLFPEVTLENSPQKIKIELI